MNYNDKMKKILELLERTTSENEREICLQKLKDVKDTIDIKEKTIKELREKFKTLYEFKLPIGYIPIPYSDYVDMIESYYNNIINEFGHLESFCKSVYNKYKLVKESWESMRRGKLYEFDSIYRYVILSNEEFSLLSRFDYERDYYIKEFKWKMKRFLNGINNGNYDKEIEEIFNPRYDDKKETDIVKVDSYTLGSIEIKPLKRKRSK